MDEQQRTTYGGEPPEADGVQSSAVQPDTDSTVQAHTEESTQSAHTAQSEPSAYAAQQSDRTASAQSAQSPYGAPPAGNPYANTQSPYGRAPYGQSAYGQSPYGTAQNPYAGTQQQNPYGYTAQSPYTGAQQNPYVQNPNPYANRPQGQNPYGQNPYYTAQNAPYGGQYPYGQNGAYPQNPYPNGQYPYGQPAYTPPRQNPYCGTPLQSLDLVKKRQSAASLRKMSMAHGLSVLGLPIIIFAVSMLLLLIPSFRETVYQENTPMYIAVNAALSLLGIFLPFFLGYLYQKKRGLLKELPLGTPYDNKAAVLLVFFGLMCCIAGSYVTNFFGAMVEGMFGITFTMPTDETVLDTPAKILLAVLGTAVIPAFVEEFAIRGTVMQPLRRYGDKFAIVMSSLVFAMMHGNMVQIPFAFIAGIAIGYAVTVSGSMWVGVAIHFLNNFSAVMMQVAVDNLPESRANLVVLAMVGVIAAVGILCAVLYFKTYARPTLHGGEGILQRGEKGKAYICTVPMILALLYLLIETAQYVEF